MSNIDKQRVIDDLASTSNLPSPEHPNCQKCGLYEKCNTPFISADGSKNADVLLIGEAPGGREDEEGKPFVGKSGKLLRGVIEDDLFLIAAYTNAVRCRPEDNAIPTTKQIKLCKSFLEKDLRKYKDANVIVPLGNTALKAITGYSGITKWRGIQLDKDGQTIFPTYHPAAVLPGRGDPLRMEQWMSDMAKLSDIVLGIKETPADVDYEYIFVESASEAEVMFSEIKTAGKCSFDLEFKWLQAFKTDNCILMASFAIHNKAWALLLFHPESQISESEQLDILDMLDEFAIDESIHKTGHNIKIDHLVLVATLGIELCGVGGDTMLLSQTVDSRGGLHDLGQLASKHLNMYDYESELRIYIEEHPEADPGRDGDYSQIPIDVLWPYAAKDAAAVYLLESILLQLLDTKQRILYEQLLVPCSTTFTRMETNGHRPDLDIIESYRKIYAEGNDQLLEIMRLDTDVQRLEKEKNAPLTDPNDDKWQKFNPRSSRQVAKVLYEFKGCEILGKTKKGAPSVAADVIEGLDEPWLEEYRLYKLYSDALSKYLTKMPIWVSSDGRIRSSYNIVGARTGRTSSKDPNMQNIPNPKKHPGTLLVEYPIKNAFTHTWPKGCLYALDFAAMEMRIMATVCRSKAMIKMFEEGKDPHTFAAAKLDRIDESEVTPLMRQRAKSVNWKMIFGGGWSGLMKDHKIPEKEARELENGWYAIFPEVLEFYGEQVKFTRKDGYSVSALGRRRYLPYIKDTSDTLRRRAERAAGNHPIQSAACDLLLMSLVIIDRIMQLHGMKSMLVNTVHDSIVFDVYPDELQELHELCVDVTTDLKLYTSDHFPGMDLSWLTVPLVVDAEYGTHYGSMKPYGGA